MATTVEVYKCTNCGGVLSYDPEWQQYGCASCGSFFDIEQFRPKTTQQLLGFTCSECGAELIVTKETASFSCPYCSNNEIVPSRFEGKFSPDSVIPFKIDKEEALRRWREHALEKPWLPDDYFIHGSLASAEGVYVPFWLFSGAVDYGLTFKYIIEDENGCTTILKRRNGSFSYRRIPADASVRMPNNMMDSLMRYKLEELQPFTTDCMPGFIAERYTESRQDSWKRIVKLIGIETCAFAESHGTGESYPNGTCVSRDVDITGPETGGVVEHVLYPVWLFSYEYGGERRLVGVNGQTGIVAANYPVDKGKVEVAGRKHFRKMLLWSIVAFAGLVAGTCFLGTGGFSFPVMVSAIVAVVGMFGAFIVHGSSGIDVGDLAESTEAMKSVHDHVNLLAFIVPESIKLAPDYDPLTY